MDRDYPKLIEILKSGGAAVIPTDTLYGIVGSALNEGTVERIYKLRKRNPEKPCIILVSDISELEKFGIALSLEQKDFFSKEEKRPTSVILDCESDELEYLHRGTKSLAFRIPHLPELRELLRKTGPLIAPSANWEGESPAENIEQAKKYFSEGVDMYVDGGQISGRASRIIKLAKDGGMAIIRE